MDPSGPGPPARASLRAVDPFDIGFLSGALVGIFAGLVIAPQVLGWLASRR